MVCKLTATTVFTVSIPCILCDNKVEFDTTSFVDYDVASMNSALLAQNIYDWQLYEIPEHAHIQAICPKCMVTFLSVQKFLEKNKILY